MEERLVIEYDPERGGNVVTIFTEGRMTRMNARKVGDLWEVGPFVEGLDDGGLTPAQIEAIVRFYLYPSTG